MPFFVKDVNTGAPIDARVFVNGAPVTSRDANGGFVLPPASGSTVVEVTAQGYATVKKTYDSGLVPDDHVDMLPMSSQPRILTLQTAAPESAPGKGDSALAGASFSLSQNGSVLESGTVQGDGSIATFSPYTDGVYQLSIDRPPYSTVNQALQVLPSQDTYILPVEASSDAGTGISTADTPASRQDQSQSAALVPSSTPPDDPEFLPVYEQWATWYTGTQARLYIGSLFIDEVEAVHYILQGNRVPVYGYASRDFDRLGTGRALVQGQLEINFVSEGYLLTVLEDYKKQRVPASDTNTQLRAQLVDLIVTAQQLRANSSDQGAIQPQLDAIDASRAQILRTLGPDDIDTAQAGLNQKAQLKLSSGYSAGIQASTPHPVYSPVMFDIELQFGTKAGGPKRRIEGCQIISCEQLIDRDSTVKESYGFIARRLR